MRRISALLLLSIGCSVLATSVADDAWAQRRRPSSPPATAQHRAVRRGAVVFVGGYFYDPFFGPYPWWTRSAYPYAYYPIYDVRATVRVVATPPDAAVYVDGFYAGIVGDFDHWFQGLPLPPGGHEIVLFLEGYRTTRDRLYLAARSTVKLHRTLRPLPGGVISERPPVAVPIPPPPDGTYMPPRTPQSPSAPVASTESAEAAAIGTLSLAVQPTGARIAIDGDVWVSSDGRSFVVQLPAGRHQIAISKNGYTSYATELEIRDGESQRLNVTLNPSFVRER